MENSIQTIRKTFFLICQPLLFCFGFWPLTFALRMLLKNLNCFLFTTEYICHFIIVDIICSTNLIAFDCKVKKVSGHFTHIIKMFARCVGKHALSTVCLSL